MAHGGSSRALRWCVARVDASLVALDYAEGEIHGRALVVDSAQRVVRSGKRTPIAWPPAPRLPDNSEWIHAARVEDTQLAIPITLLVFRAKVSANRSADSQRPAKRARRDGETAATTRLFFFAISSGSSSSDWQLQSLGVVAVDGDPSALQMHVMDGPSAVAFNTATSTLSLLQPRITDDGEYAFTALFANVALPSAAKAELLSCQFVGEEVTSTPHLLFQYAEVQEQLQEDDVAWRPPSEHQRLWATLPLHTRGTTNAVMLPCPYLPSRSVSQDFPTSESEQITSCAFVPPPSPSCSTAQSVTSACASTPQLRSSVVSLFGMATGTLRVISNDVLLASYVLAGVAHHIQITNAHGGSGSAFVAAISCGDSDRAFHLLSIDVWTHRHHAVSPLQHFTFVGSMTDLPFDNDDVHRMVLLNDVASLTNEDDCLALSLRKSVVLACSPQLSGHVTSSCHRLKHRADQKASKKRGLDRHGVKEDDGFQAIERVKVDKRDQRDFVAHHHTTKNPSSASEQQLEMLTKSLQERLRVGVEHADRLEQVCNEKRKMVQKLNELLVASDDYGTDSSGSDDVSVELVPVVTPASPVENSATGSSTVLAPRHRWLKQVGTLEKASAISFDRTRSRLRIALDIQACLYTKEDGGNSSSSNSAAGLSAFAVDYTKTFQAMRSWSSVRHVSRPQSLQEISERRVTIDLTIELPPSVRRPKEHHFRLGLWLRVEPSDVLLNQTSTRLIGELVVDLTSLAEEVCNAAYASRFHASHDEHLRPPCDEYLFVSAGSSLPETILSPRENSKLTQSQLQLVRPLFAVVTSEPPSVHAAHSHEDQRIDTLLRALPRDVVTMVNPLALSSLEVVQSLILLLKSELDQACGLENHFAPTEREDRSPTSRCRQLLSTQLRTDLQALRVLNEWQRRINFQSS